MIPADNAVAEDSAASDGHWSAATGENTVAAAQAMRELAASYWYPVYAWWRHVGCDAKKAASATEACFSRWIEREPPRRDDSGGGRFREWLLRRLPVLAVSGVKPWPQPLHTIDRAWAEQAYASEPEGSPDEILARRFSIETLEFALENLRAEETAAGRGSDFLAKVSRLGSATEAADDAAIVAFRQRFRTLLRALVADTIVEAARVDHEITTQMEAAHAEEGQSAGLPEIFGGLTPDALFACALATAGGMEDAARALAIEELARAFPQYEILERIGAGGVGAVYRARQKTLDRLVALKVLPAGASADRDYAGRFLHEAHAMSRLHHENIVAVYEVGESAEGHLFYAMECVDGAALDARLREGALPAGAALHVATQMCDALTHSHGLGVLHGDLKPGNVLLSRSGQVKVSDFGLTRQPGANREAPEYLAPEQKRALAVDQRSDVYATGVLLYEMLCGEAPLGVCDPPSVRAGVDQRLDGIVQRAMQADPARRFPTIGDMKAALVRVRDTAPEPVPVAVVQPVPVVVPARPPRHPAWWAGAAAAALILGLGLVFALRPKEEPLTAAQKMALARTELAKHATPKPVASTPKPKPKPAVAKSSTPKPAAPKPAAPTPEPAVAAPMIAAAPAPPAPPAPTATPPPASPPPAATPAPLSEFAKWLASTSAEMQAAFQWEVQAPYETATARARQQYVAAIDANIAGATAAGKRDLVVALRAERQRVESGQTGAPEGAAPPVPELAPLRTIWRTQVTKLDAERAQRARALHARYDSMLAQQETRLTQAQKLDDAQAIKARRAEVAAAWLPAVDASVQTATTATVTSAPLPRGRLAALPLLNRLLALHAKVRVRDGPGRTAYEVRNVSELKADKFLWQEVEFRARPEGGAPVTDGDLALLDQLRDVPEVVINGIPVTDEAIERLRGFQSLRHLRLENLQKITSKSLEVLFALPELRSLALVNLPFGDDSIARIAELSKLTKLRINDLPLTDAALDSIATMPALEELDFGGGKIRTASQAWERLLAMRKLTRLTCKASEVDLVLAGALARYTGLTSLNFEGRPVTDATLALLQPLSRLTTLNVGGTKVTGSVFKTWPVRPMLTTLYLDDCPGLDDSVLRAIVAAFPKLDRLEIGGVAGAITPAGAADLARLRVLKNLRIAGEAATDGVAVELAKVESLTQLDVDKARITEAGLNSLAKLPRLNKLVMANPPITNEAIRAFKKFKMLKEIDVPSETPEAIQARLRSDLPGVMIR